MDFKRILIYPLFTYKKWERDNMAITRTIDRTFPMDDSYIADFPKGYREQLEAILDSQIVNAGKLQGLTVGNENGQIPVNNGNENKNLNAGKLNGKTSADFAEKGHVHTVATANTNGFLSNADKQKLDKIASGAEVNQNTFSNIKVGTNTIQADNKQDTLEITAGNNVTITPDVTNDKLTIAFSDNKVSNATNADNASTSDKLKNTGTIKASTLPKSFATGLTNCATYNGSVAGDNFPCQHGNLININNLGNAQLLCEWLGDEANSGNVGKLFY